MRRGPAAVFVIISAWMLEQFASSIENSTVNLSASFSMYISIALNQIGKGLKPKCGKEYEVLTATFSFLVLLLFLGLFRLLPGRFPLALLAAPLDSRSRLASSVSWALPPALARVLPRQWPRLSLSLSLRLLHILCYGRRNISAAEGRSLRHGLLQRFCAPRPAGPYGKRCLATFPFRRCGD